MLYYNTPRKRFDEKHRQKFSGYRAEIRDDCSWVSDSFNT